MTRDLVHVRWFEAFVNPAGFAKYAWVGVLAALTGAVGWLVHASGGTAYVYVHAAYLPILLAAMLFKVRGSLIVALALGVILGPWMPFETAAGTVQSTANWLYRTGFFALVAVFAGLLFAALQAQMDRLRRLAFEDIETHLPNRLSLDVQTRNAFHDARRDKRHVYLLSVRIANFDSVVTALGQAAGNSLLNQLGEELEALAGGLGSVYRTGGKSFALLLPGSSRTRSQEIVDEVFRIVGDAHAAGGVTVHLDAHVGMAAYPVHEDEAPESLIRKSIQALHTAQDAGRRWSAYDAGQDATRRETLALLGELKPALDRDQLELHYQPKVSVATGEVAGFEALVRWRHPQRGMVPPGLFIPAAEQTGLIHPLTRWVLEAALSRLHVWRREGIETSIAVNISGRNLADDSFLDWARDLITEYRLPPGALEFELTENSLFLDAQSVIAQLEELRELGIGLAIDDFGTGYSSLTYLERLPVTALKVDRTFVANLGDRGGTSAKIVRASVQLAQNLGIRTVAEGVETDEVLAGLHELGCSEFQGYLCARPMPGDDATTWWRANAGVWKTETA